MLQFGIAYGPEIVLILLFIVLPMYIIYRIAKAILG